MNGLQIKLDSQSKTESVNYDYFEVYYKRDNKYYLVGKYGGSSIANSIILVPCLDFYVHWKTDGSSNYYGFKIASITPTENAVEGTLYTPKALVPIEGTGLNYPETEHPYNVNEECIWHYVYEDLSYCEIQSISGAKIGDKHTAQDWGLQLTDVEMGDPSAKVKTVSVPGRNGVLDLTESLAGEVKYNNRTVRLTFVLIDKSMARWQTMDSIIKNYCHGRVMDVILDSDAQWYWHGRCSVETTKEDAIYSRFVISIDADPYKYDINSTTTEWIWDSFNFETGIIREYKDIEVSGTKTITVIGSSTTIVPSITCSAAMTVTYNNVTYNLVAGKNKVADIQLHDGANSLTFRGTGTVTIEYRGLSL